MSFLEITTTDIETKERELRKQLDEARNAKDSQAITLYQKLLEYDFAVKSDGIFKIMEDAVYNLSGIYKQLGLPNELAGLNHKLRPFFNEIPKAKTAKIVRSIIETVGEIPNTHDIQIEICKECIEWTQKEKRKFLRQWLESRLASLYFEKKSYPAALSLINKLLKEVRKLDDKALLVETQLLESHVHLALRNIAKAKAALTSARTAANAIYCPPLLQAEIDMQSGTLHAEEKDYKTGYSYFFEAFEGFNSLDNPNAVLCLKYMLLCKIMTNAPEDVQQILSGKNALRYSGNQIEAMRAISAAYQERSLHALESGLKKFKKELVDDSVIGSHLSDLYDNLLEQHLLRIIEPFSRVEISHVSQLINLPRENVERKLSQMILDKKFNGILDQGKDCLVVFEERKKDKLYPGALDTIDNMNVVMDSLFDRAKQLFVKQ